MLPFRLVISCSEHLFWQKRDAAATAKQGFDYDSTMLRSPGVSARFPGFSEAGEILDHYVNSLEWRMPRELWLEGPSLGWDARPVPGLVVEPGPGMLEVFVKLASRSDDAILDYAREWGPLWLCVHGKYWQHGGIDCMPGPSSEARWYTRWERLKNWRDLATEARAVLRIARNLNMGRLGNPEDWKLIPRPDVHMMRMYVPWDEAQWIDERSEAYHEASLTDEGFDELERRIREWKRQDRARSDFIPDDEGTTWESVPGRVSIEIDERLLAFVIDDWIERGCVQLNVFRSNGKRTVRLKGGGLMGALAVQLVFEVCRTDGLAICTACGTPYLPIKRPRRDQNPYCLDCGLKAAQRDAAARYRLTDKYREAQRRRQARKLAASGDVRTAKDAAAS